jgi:hypothetical protein
LKRLGRDRVLMSEIVLALGFVWGIYAFFVELATEGRGGFILGWGLLWVGCVIVQHILWAGNVHRSEDDPMGGAM